jgi:hypothetical protein
MPPFRVSGAERAAEPRNILTPQHGRGIARFVAKWRVEQEPWRRISLRESGRKGLRNWPSRMKLRGFWRTAVRLRAMKVAKNRRGLRRSVKKRSIETALTTGTTRTLGRFIVSPKRSTRLMAPNSSRYSTFPWLPRPSPSRTLSQLRTKGGYTRHR